MDSTTRAANRQLELRAFGVEEFRFSGFDFETQGLGVQEFRFPDLGFL